MFIYHFLSSQYLARQNHQVQLSEKIPSNGGRAFSQSVLPSIFKGISFHAPWFVSLYRRLKVDIQSCPEFQGRKMPHRSHRDHHGGHKKPLKASSMATRGHRSSDSKKLLTKTYSEIGVSNNGHNAAETPTPSEKVSKWHRDILLVSPPNQQNPVILGHFFWSKVLDLIILWQQNNWPLWRNNRIWPKLNKIFSISQA